MARRGGRNVGLDRALAFLHLDDDQFELLDEELAALGGPSELLPTQLGDQQLELLGCEPTDQRCLVWEAVVNRHERKEE